MKIQHIHLYNKNGKAGVSAQIIFNSGKSQSMFFEVEEQYADHISQDATQFLAAMLPIAMLAKEDIYIDGAVSGYFLTQTPEIMKIVQDWHLGFSPIAIKVKETIKDSQKSKHVGCFFSGGADSYYTYLKNKKRIDSLIFVHGFDIKVTDNDLYSMVEKNITNIAESQRVRLIKVKTNIREIYDQCFTWNLAHGFAVGSVSLFLRNGFTSIYVSCGLSAKNKNHSSMTPDLDPLWSSEHMRVIHYGCEADKLLKLKELSKFPVAMDTLRVCWVNRKNAYNCNLCEKCMRNMLGLYLCDALQKCKTFSGSINLDRLRKIKVGVHELKYFTSIRDALDKKGDTTDVRIALEVFINSNSSPSTGQKILGGFRNGLRTMDAKYNHHRLYWFMVSKGII